MNGAYAPRRNREPFPEVIVDEQPPAPATNRPASVRSSTSSSNRQRSRSTSPAPPPGYEAATAEWQEPEHPRTAQDLITEAGHRCWICFEGDEPGRHFVHACKCSLIAHEDCLLEWVSSYQQTHPSDGAVAGNANAADGSKPKCPVCAAPYKIVENKYPLLAWAKSAKELMEEVSMIGVATGAVGGGFIAASAYGAWAIRTFAGPDVLAALFRRSKWPWGLYMNLPMAPMFLVMSRGHYADVWLPLFPLSVVFTSPPSPNSIASWDDRLLGIDAWDEWSYPPSPALAFVLLPFARIIYMNARRWVFTSLFGREPTFASPLLLPDLRTPRRAIPAANGVAPGQPVAEEDDPAPPGGWMGAFQRRVVAGVEVEIDVDAIPGGGAEAEEDANEAVGPPARAGAPMLIRLGVGKFASMILGALIFPLLARWAGDLLLALALRGKSSSFLRKLLGVPAAAAVTFTAQKQSSGALAWLLGGSAPAVRPRARPDPIWWRSTVGAGAVLLARDLVEIGFGLLEQRKVHSRKVKSTEFRPGTAARTNARQSSGGRNARGREARVVNLL